MPPKKQTKITTYYGKKTPTTNYRRKRFYGKSITKNMNLKQQIYSFKRRFQQAVISGNAAYNPYLTGVSWSLNQLPSVSEFTSLFDRYKITYIKLYVHLKVDPSAQSATAATYPKLYYIKDFDDASTPASLDALREYANCQVKVLNPNRPVVIRIRPSQLNLVYRTGISSSYTPKWNQWVDMGTTDIPFYGLKMGIDNLTNTNYTVDIEAKMWFKCKAIR